ncbi:MAG: DnaD domain-containing protein [Dehalococcoidia bacterium]
MTHESVFSGFPAVARATTVPNIFFSVVLPRLRASGDLLAFLWASRLVQEQRGEVRFVTAGQIWEQDGAAEAFHEFGGGREGLDGGLRRCVEVGALLGVEVVGRDGEETVYLVNNPGSRRAVARARGGELELRPETVVRAIAVESRPGIFRLYEENVGTITPIVGERLIAAADEYPWEWIEDAFREAAELNKRNWRYVERILQNWAQEGRNEAPQQDPVGPQQRLFGGATPARRA